MTVWTAAIMWFQLKEKTKQKVWLRSDFLWGLDPAIAVLELIIVRDRIDSEWVGEEKRKRASFWVHTLNQNLGHCDSVLIRADKDCSRAPSSSRGPLRCGAERGRPWGAVRYVSALDSSEYMHRDSPNSEKSTTWHLKPNSHRCDGLYRFCKFQQPYETCVTGLGYF